MDEIKIGNGSGLSVKHIRTSQIRTPSLAFKLFNVLHVPNICENLISVQKCTQDTNTFFEFLPSYFLLKDRATGKLIHRGPSNHGLYSFFLLPIILTLPLHLWVNVHLCLHGILSLVILP
jgi:hypothetical protein